MMTYCKHATYDGGMYGQVKVVGGLWAGSTRRRHVRVPDRVCLWGGVPVKAACMPFCAALNC